MDSNQDLFVYENVDLIVTSLDNGRSTTKLYDAARKIAKNPLCWGPSKEIIKYAGKGKVILTTGFPVICEGKTYCETDGPPGIIRLAHCLAAIDIEPIIIADKQYSSKILALMKPADTRFITISNTQNIEKIFLDTLININPALLIGVESPARNMDNHYYDMHGYDLTNLCIPFDRMFEIATRLGIKTIGIGDGGNEIGMGLIADTVKRCIRHGEKIASKIRTDFLIVGSTSNWAAYGLIAAISMETKKPLLRNEELEKKLFEAGAERQKMRKAILKQSADLHIDIPKDIL